MIIKRHFPGSVPPGAPSAIRRRPRRATEPGGVPAPRSAPGVGHTPQDGVE